MPNPEQITRQEKVHRYRCPDCGANVLFEQQEGNLRCPACGRREEVVGGAGTEERSYEKYLHPSKDQLRTLASNALEVQCQTCSATVTFTPPEVADECPFCGSRIVAQPKPADPVVAPERVLPFRLTQAESGVRVRSWFKSRWFAPNALKKFAAHKPVAGVYIPFWSYDLHTVNRYRGQRGDHYSETETYTESDEKGNSVTKTREVERTRWRDVSGAVSRWFDDTLVPATKSLPQNCLDALEPWDLAELRSYEPACLSGYKALRYQVDIAEGFERAKELSAPAIAEEVRFDIGGAEQKVDQISTRYSGITFKHLLLPLYIGAYRFRDRVYQVVVNARTGEVQGERPYSFWKILCFVLLLLMAIALAVRLSTGSWPLPASLLCSRCDSVIDYASSRL